YSNEEFTASPMGRVKMKLKHAITVAAAALCFQAQAQNTAPATDAAQPLALEGVAAVVNDEVISFTDVRNRAQLILISFGVEASPEAIAQAQARAIESLIEERLQMQEAAEYELEVSEEDVTRQVAGLAARNGIGPDEFLNNLWGQGINPATLRDQVKADIAWRRLVGGRFGQRVRVSDLQIDDVKERISTNMGKDQYRLSEIFLPAGDPDTRAQARQGAIVLREQIEQGAPFQLVAQQFSASSTASAGGELGWVTGGEVREEIVAVIEDLTPPAISPPIETQDGFYLIAVMDKRDPVAEDEGTALLRQLISRSSNAAALVTEAAEAASDCDGVEAAADAVDGVSAVNLGEIALSELNDTFKQAVMATEPGASTEVLELPSGAAQLYVCDKSLGGAAVPDRDAIEDRIYEQQLAMLADRYLRDLKREATIIRR
ncbi:MAG: peptidylprolyl isomerase, partial [Pseudomonadota bacterium]